MTASLKRRLLTGGSWVLAGKVVTAASNVLISSLVARLLSEEGFGAFGLAFSLVFIFPPGTILLLFLAIFGLVFFVVTGHVIRLTCSFLATRMIRRDVCPSCRHTGTLREVDFAGLEDSEGARLCRACGNAFHASGLEIEPEEILGVAPTP